jgi:hypothetical protein
MLHFIKKIDETRNLYYRPTKLYTQKQKYQQKSLESTSFLLGMNGQILTKNFDLNSRSLVRAQSAHISDKERAHV